MKNPALLKIAANNKQLFAGREESFNILNIGLMK